MIGDVVGEAGLSAVERELPALIQEHNADFVTVNGENAADGFGITEKEFHRILDAGADVVTTGNHVWEKRDFWAVLDTDPRVVRPANYPPGAVGHGWTCVEKDGVSWIVVNLQGRELMNAIDCPFRAFDTAFAQINTANIPAPSVVLVDFHAEGTREKEALGFYLDGKAQVIVGTHTHVQTADNRILPRGSAYITDIGMTGVQESIIGMNTEICVNRAKRHVLYQMKCALGMGHTRGIVAELDAEAGKAWSIDLISVGK